MPRRDEKFSLHDYFETGFSESAWWAGPVVAGVIFAAFYYVVPLVIGCMMSDGVFQKVGPEILVPLSKGLAPWFFGFILVIWVFSLLKRLMR